MTKRRTRLVAGCSLALLLPAVVACDDDSSGGAPAAATSAAQGTSASSVTSGSATTTTKAAAEPQPRSEEELAAALDLALEELVSMPGGPPGAISVVQVGDREPTVHAAGVSDLDGDAPPAGDQHMRVASVAKAFSGATALSLVDEGVLSLDDTIGERLPTMPAAFAAVTLRQLLSHTSGLPDLTKAPAFGQAVRASLAKAPPPEQLLSYIADEPLVFEPGTEYKYSNSDNIAVGLMIQEATGRPYSEVLQEKVLDRLGLKETSLPVGVEIPEPFIHGYALFSPDPIEDVSTQLAGGWAWASGGIVSTPNDLNTFIRGYVSGELYSDKVRAEQQNKFIPGGESGPPGPALNSASLALFRYDTPCGTVYGHTGNTIGFTQFAVATPDGTRSATVSINLQRTDESEGQAAHVFDALHRVEQSAICLLLQG